MATEKKKFEVTIGEDLDNVSLYFVYKNGRPYNLTGATDIEVKIPTSSGVAISKKLSLSELTVVSYLLGHVTINQISDTNSALLKEGKGQNLHGIVDVGTNRRRFNFDKVMDVLKPSVS